MLHIEFREVDFSYGAHSIIGGLSLNLTAPVVVGLIGRSGGGKTTLLKLLAGILTPVAGEIQNEAQHVSWVPQDAGLFPWLTIAENIAFPLSLARQRDTKERRSARARALSDELRLSGAANRYPADASGGEKQRAAIARAIAASSDLLLLDEPFASLDPMAREDLRKLLRRITAIGEMITVFASHDLFDVATLSDAVVVLREKGPPVLIHEELPRIAAGKLRSQTAAGQLVKVLMRTLQAQEDIRLPL